MPAAPHLLVEDDGAIIICTLNRPDKLNAISGQMLELLETALHRFRDTPALKVMLIRATGRYFSAGVDLRDAGTIMSARTGSEVRERHRVQLHGAHRIYDEMEHIEKPIVVAHQGVCVGGGLEMSLSCDFRLAAKSAQYSFRRPVRRASRLERGQPPDPHLWNPLGAASDHGEHEGARRKGTHYGSRPRGVSRRHL